MSRNGVTGRGMAGRLLDHAVAATVCLAAWETTARIVDSTYFPGAVTVLAWLARDWWFLLACGAATTARATVGLLIAVVLGGALGMGMSLHRGFDRFATPIVDFLRPVPSSALILLCVMWMGLDSPSVVVTAYGCVWPVLTATRDAMNSVSREVRLTLEILRVGRLRQFTAVYSRSLLPGLLSGVRIAVSIALILAVTAELVVAPTTVFGYHVNAKLLGGPRSDLSIALGGYLQYQYESGSVAGVIAAVLMSGILGVAVNRSYHAAYKVIMRRYAAREVVGS